MKRLVVILLMAAAAASYRSEIEQWQKARAASLTKPDGWTTLVGLDWLSEGRNPLKLPGGPAAGTIVLTKGVATIEPSPKSGMTIDDKPVTKPVVLKNDFDPNGPTIVKRGSVQFQIIRRDPKFAVRIKDANADARVHFKGLDYFPIDPKWRIVARFIPYKPPKHIPITNVLGMTSDEISPGALVFRSPADGKEYRIDPIDEEGEKDLFIIIKDATSRDATYQAARYLYAHQPAADGTTVVDFNKAYNPPCVFTAYATCPLPPKQNVLPFRIEAGEKRYKGHH